MIKAVQFVTLLLFSLVTGVFWGTWFSLTSWGGSKPIATCGETSICEIYGPQPPERTAVTRS